VSASCRRIAFLAAVTVLMLTAGADRASAQAESEVVALDRDLVRLDTSNPPGNEAQVANFMAARLAPLGFEVSVIPTPTPGKAHLIARLRSTSPVGKPVLLSAHSDTVGVERELWSVDPFAGVIKDGYLYGRGGFDDKGGIAVFATAASRLARAHVPLKRDIVLVFEGDEEGGDFGIDWLAENHWDQLDAAFSINEGGIISTNRSGKPNLAAVTVRDKISFTVTLETRGVSTHSSRPQPPSAIDRLARALARLSRHHGKAQLSPLTRRYFRAAARASGTRLAAAFRRLARAHGSGAVARAAARAVRRSPYGPLVNALVRVPKTATIIEGGIRANVIPGRAEATVNMRLLPGVRGQEAVRELRRAIHDRRVKIHVETDDQSADEVYASINKRQRIPASSTDSDLYRALARELRAQYPGIIVTPALYEAATDAEPWRERGIPVYGIRPYPASPTDLRNMHGVDERVSVAGLAQGTDMVERILREVAAR
jgi:acetylornithine deacetylase/succinyl-diaminopimelate desuccinylase-like protein